MVHGTEEPMINARTLLEMNNFWSWVLSCIDKTGTDVYQRAGLEHLSFTFTIFNRECHYKSEAWRVLGYIPDLEMKSSAYKAKQHLGAKGK